MSFITGIPIQNETAQKYTTPNECHEQISPLYGRGGVWGGLLMVLWALAAYFFVNWP